MNKHYLKYIFHTLFFHNSKVQFYEYKHQKNKHVKEESESANLKWVLMDKLCRASIIKQEDYDQDGQRNVVVIISLD